MNAVTDAANFRIPLRGIYRREL